MLCLHRPVSKLRPRLPVIIGESTTVRQAARKMRDARVDNALVVSGGGEGGGSSGSAAGGGGRPGRRGTAASSGDLPGLRGGGRQLLRGIITDTDLCRKVRRATLRYCHFAIAEPHR